MIVTTWKDSVYKFEPSFENKEILKGTYVNFQGSFAPIDGLLLKWQRLDLEKAATIEFL